MLHGALLCRHVTISQNLHLWASPRFPEDHYFPFQSSTQLSPTSLCSLPVPHSRHTTVSQGSKPEGPKLLLFLRNDPRERKTEWNESKRRCGREVCWSFLNKFRLFSLFFSFWTLGSITSAICYSMPRPGGSQVSIRSNKMAEGESAFPEITYSHQRLPIDSPLTCEGRLYFLQAVTWAMTLAWLSLLTLMPFTLMMHWPGWRPATAATVPDVRHETGKERLEDTPVQATAGEQLTKTSVESSTSTKLRGTFLSYLF